MHTSRRRKRHIKSTRRPNTDPYGRPDVIRQWHSILNGDPAGNRAELPPSIYQRYVVERTRDAARHLFECRGPVDPLAVHAKRVTDLEDLCRTWRCEFRPCPSCENGWILWARTGLAATWCARCADARERRDYPKRQRKCLYKDREAGEKIWKAIVAFVRDGLGGVIDLQNPKEAACSVPGRRSQRPVFIDLRNARHPRTLIRRLIVHSVLRSAIESHADGKALILNAVRYVTKNA